MRALAATDWAPFTEPLFEHLGRNQGLPNDVVGRIVQDSTGFLWFGTGGGLVRFDGHRFRHFTADPSDPTSLPDSYITAIHIDPMGVLWIGTNAGGLARFNPASESFDRFDAGFLNNSIQSILTDAKGRLWTGTVGGVHVRDPVDGSVRFFHHRTEDPDSTPLDQVRDMLEMPDGGLLLASGRGLVRLDPDTGQADATVLDRLLSPGTPTHRLLRDSRGRLWVTGEFPGIAMWDPATGEQRLFDLLGAADPAASPLSKFALTELGPDRIGIGTQGAGLVMLDVGSARVEVYRHDPTQPTSLAASDVRSLTVDRSGILWVGTWGGGISRRNPPTAAVRPILASQIRPDRLSDPQVRSLMLDDQGRLWAGLQNNGIDILDPATGQRTGIRPGPGALPEGAVLAMHGLPDGTVFIGTQRGLYKRRPGQTILEPVALPPPSPNAAVWFLWHRDGVLWVATDGLVSMDLATGTMKVERSRFGDQTSLFDNRVRLLAPAPGGRLWVGGHGGMHLFDPANGGFRRIRHEPADPQSLSHDFITAILTDQRGRVWVGTLGGGINILEPGWSPGTPAQFRRLGTTDGLPTLMINALREDASGRIWASTDAGLAVIDAETMVVQVLDRPDGIGVNSFWANSAVSGADGQIMFGGRSGLVVVRPDLLDAWRLLPPTVVTELRIGDRVVPADIYNHPSPPAIHLSPEDRSLSVEFAALDYTAPERTRFLYRLEGFEEQWTAGDATRRHVAYANLAPGTYQLMVRGSNREGLFGAKALVLPVTVLPAWYQTWWFRLALLLSGVGLIAAAVQLRTLRLRQRQRELEEEVAERTEEIARQKDALSATLADLRNTQDRLVREEKLASLGRLVSGVAHELNTPLGVAITSSSFLSQEMTELGGAVAGKSLTRNALSEFLATGQEVMGVLDTNLQRAARLVQSFKQVSAEEYVGPKQLVPLQPLVRDVLDALAPQFRQQNIETKIVGTVDMGVMAQPAPLSHVLMNLAQNALQHAFDGSGGGTVTVTLSIRDGHAVIIFADDGMGMGAEVREKAFDPFFTTTRDHGGTGLGLHIAHNLVTGPLGGDIRLETAPARGSRFIITLPDAVAIALPDQS